MKPDDVLIGVSASSKGRLLQQLSERAARALGVSEHDILAALTNREALGSTGIGAGIAIPHAPIADLERPFALLVRLTEPIEFDAIDDEPVDIVCLILTPPEGQAKYLKLLSNVAKQLRSADVVKEIRSTSEAEHIYSAFTRCDD
ncbi:PTS sugar transporter subunit IIA [Nitratireductor soli]|uniref:PTS sugar transporter subunit IIA n=1 Tax=Nitratireductor soli TaxID=1670619 RepID=UPI0009E306F3|nr:PTS sugar transporter subunit IIA [Nitratireductor soli]